VRERHDGSLRPDCGPDGLRQPSSAAEDSANRPWSAVGPGPAGYDFLIVIVPSLVRNPQDTVRPNRASRRSVRRSSREAPLAPRLVHADHALRRRCVDVGPELIRQADTTPPSPVEMSQASAIAEPGHVQRDRAGLGVCPQRAEPARREDGSIARADADRAIHVLQLDGPVAGVDVDVPVESQTRTEPSPVRNSRRPLTRSAWMDPSPLRASTLQLRGTDATSRACRVMCKPPTTTRRARARAPRHALARPPARPARQWRPRPPCSSRTWNLDQHLGFVPRPNLDRPVKRDEREVGSADGEIAAPREPV